MAFSCPVSSLSPSSERREQLQLNKVYSPLRNLSSEANCCISNPFQYVFSSSSPIQHVILKRPLSGIVAFTLEEVCKKNASRWVQYANSMMNGSDRKELDSLLFSSIRKNYSSLMKIVNLVLDDNQVSPMVMKPSSLK